MGPHRRAPLKEVEADKIEKPQEPDESSRGNCVGGCLDYKTRTRPKFTPGSAYYFSNVAAHEEP